MMNLLTRIACAALLPASLLIAQQTQPAAALPVTGEAVIVIHPLSLDLDPPRIRLTDFPLAQRNNCKHARERSAKVFMVIDASGKPHFPPGDATGHIGWAAQFLQFEHYIPAVLHQNPVAVALHVDLELNVCTDKHAAKNLSVDPTRLSRQPKVSFEPVGVPVTQVVLSPDGLIENFSTDQVQNVELVAPGWVDPPRLIYAPEAQFPEAARGVASEGTCWLDAIVGTNGRVQQVGLMQGTNSVFVPYALQAVRSYRFHHATRNGVPVPVDIEVEIRFRTN